VWKIYKGALKNEALTSMCLSRNGISFMDRPDAADEFSSLVRVKSCLVAVRTRSPRVRSWATARCRFWTFRSTTSATTSGWCVPVHGVHRAAVGAEVAGQATVMTRRAPRRPWRARWAATSRCSH
jgi:hypothetical protein